MLRSKPGKDSVAVRQPAECASQVTANLIADGEHHDVNGPVSRRFGEGEVEPNVGRVEAIQARPIE